MLRTLHRSAALALCAWLICFPARAELDGPDTYVYVEVSVREATIEGMRQRLALLQSADYTREADEVADQGARVRIADAYRLFGTNASEHAAYGTRNAELIAAWLDENPTWKERYASLDVQFRSLSNQLSALRRVP